MFTSFNTVAALAVFVTIGQTQDFNRPFAAVIPRTWDDAAIQTQEVPLAHSAYSPIHITADYYYRMPVRPIYQSYPVYAAGHEPAGYTHWLTQQSPVVLWDDHGHHPRLETEADWIRAGEMVFDSAFNYDDLGFLVSEIRDPVVQRELGGLVGPGWGDPFRALCGPDEWLRRAWPVRLHDVPYPCAPRRIGGQRSAGQCELESRQRP